MSAETHRKITVIGAGSWGTALALLLARNQHSVMLWARNNEHVAQMQAQRENSRYLPGTAFPENLSVTSDLQQAVGHGEEILIVIPSQGFRDICHSVKSQTGRPRRITYASKGLEPKSNKLLHKIIEEEFGPETHFAILSGPTFAKEVAKGLPTAITVASNDTQLAQDWAEYLHNETFRAYTSPDVIGVEIGGAVKNILAIAAGIADGLHFGANTRAALITRGLVEIQRLGTVLGAAPETFMGLAGLGDLVLTCTDNQSRNRRVGLGLAEGKPLQQILDELGQVAEGVYTTQEVHELAKSLNVEMPIVEHVYRILYQKEKPLDAVHSLLSRAIKPENQ